MRMSWAVAKHDSDKISTGTEWENNKLRTFVILSHIRDRKVFASYRFRPTQEESVQYGLA